MQIKCLYIICFFILCLTFIACTENKKPPENIRFDFSVKRSVEFDSTLDINATLFNDNTDTVYFLTTTCDGEQYSLQYDISKFVLTHFITCNASYLWIDTIIPKGRFDFQTHFKNLQKESKIKLGFDFYQVNKSYDLKKHSKDGPDYAIVFNRKESEKTIVWATEKSIQ